MRLWTKSFSFFSSWLSPHSTFLFLSSSQKNVLRERKKLTIHCVLGLYFFQIGWHPNTSSHGLLRMHQLWKVKPATGLIQQQQKHAQMLSGELSAPLGWVHPAVFGALCHERYCPQGEKRQSQSLWKDLKIAKIIPQMETSSGHLWMMQLHFIVSHNIPNPSSLHSSLGLSLLF